MKEEDATMKRILSLILALLILLTATVVTAEDKDPIVGGWYTYMEVQDGPMVDTLGNYTVLLIGLIFEENGSIRLFEHDFTPTDCNTSGPGFSGKWSVKADGSYDVSIMGAGSGTVYLKDGILYLPMTESVYYAFQPFVHMDWYSDIINDSILKLKLGL